LKVTVEYLGYLKQTIGVEQGEHATLKEDAVMRDLLVLLAEKHGEPFQKAVYEPKDTELKPHYIFSLNGLLHQSNDIGTKLKDGDRVVFMPVVTGG
jgi:MoaD family protein